MSALVRNSADEAQVVEAKDKSKSVRDRELEDIYNLANGPNGDAFLRFVWRYLGTCGVFRTSFTGNSHTFFLEGHRNVGLQLLADVNEADMNIYVRMVQANKKDEENNGTRKKRYRTGNTRSGKQ
jgi:hypothetical protein